jgi:hypothetical protein
MVQNLLYGNVSVQVLFGFGLLFEAVQRGWQTTSHCLV